MRFDRRLMYNFDWLSFLVLIVLCALGLLFIFSATYTSEHPYSIFFKKQLFGIITGITLYLICSFTPYKHIYRLGYFAYFAVIALLMFTLAKGAVKLGAQRWIDVMLFRFQPSELTKFFFPCFITYFLHTQNDLSHYRLKDYLPILTIMGVSFLLILKQPDLGTALIFLGSSVITLWLSGLPRIFFIISITVSIGTAPVLYHCLKPYQKERIMVFFGAGSSHKERYQIEQSKIAVGSGGLTGKGFLQGTQNKLAFLPEGRTDFIFSVICEEWGLIGAIFVIALFCLLFTRIILLAIQRSFFPAILALGLAMPLLLSTLINIAMVIGLLPTVGIPLPLLSYGISHLWITCISFGTINATIIRSSIER